MTNKTTVRSTKQKGKNKNPIYGGLTFKLLISFASIFILALIGLGIGFAVDRSNESATESLLQFVFASWPFAVVVLVISITISAIVIKAILKPLNSLEAAMQAVTDGDFSVRLPRENATTEIGSLIESFNKMTLELQHNETLKTDFIANVSHEFKTPLSSISGYAILLSDPALSDEERRSYSDNICAAVRKLSALTGNMLRLTRLENSTISGERRRFDLSEQIRQCVLFAEPQWTQKELALDLDLQELSYFGDEDMLHQVWQNLIDNAIKFSEKGGSITIKLTQTSQGIRFLIRDTGIGMSEKTMTHIFEKFYQGDESHSVDGNGLGLSLVKRIIEAIGATIEVASEPGAGSTFSVLLPTDE